MLGVSNVTDTVPLPALLWAARGLKVAGGPVLRLWASCPGGCEPEAAAELAALGWTQERVPTPAGAVAGVTAGLYWERGSVYGRADLGQVYATLAAARTISRVTALLTAVEQDDLDGIGEVVRALDLSGVAFAPFAVRAERHGEHPFRSPDLGRVAGQAVIDTYRAATGRRLPVNLDDPTTVLRVELSGRRLRVGLELTVDSLHHRPYLRYQHPAGLKPTIAAALLLMAGWRRDERLLDPMCGGGTILVEAGLAALRWPPAAGIRSRLPALSLHDPTLAEAAAAALHEVGLPPQALPILGIERYGTHARGARRNLAAAALRGTFQIRRGDATVLEGVGDVDCIIVNPPYGMRIGSPRNLDTLYRGALERAAEHLAPGGRVLLLTAAARVAERAAQTAGLVLDEARPVSLGSLRAMACRFVPPVG